MSDAANSNAIIPGLVPGIQPSASAAVGRVMDPGHKARDDAVQNAARAPLFSADNLSVAFGGIRAVDGVTFDVKEGEIFAIVGPNGAGKSTIFNLISRIYEPTGGRLTFAGEDITRVAPHTIAGRGIARTFQNIELFEPLGIYGRWLKIKAYFNYFPLYRRATFKRQRSYLKTERVR